jgi:hypothetical protein
VPSLSRAFVVRKPVWFWQIRDKKYQKCRKLQRIPSKVRVLQVVYRIKRGRACAIVQNKPNFTRLAGLVPVGSHPRST